MAIYEPGTTVKAAIIGSGSGGLTAAIGLAGFGHTVALIEGGDVGGDCTNLGCIPSKALLHAARTGIDDPFRWARAKRDALRDDEDHEMTEHKRIALVRGWARLTDRRDPHVVEVVGPDGSVSEVRAEHVVISSGSSPVRFDVAGLPADRLITNEEVFELEAPPRSIVLIGGGAIALEMATALSDLGTTVSIVERAPRILGNEDPVISDAVTKAMAARGVVIHTGTIAERFDAATNRLWLADGTAIAEVELVMLAVGRRPNLDRLGLDTAGLEYTSHGIVADDWGRTNVDGIWAIGDVTGNTLTTHGANAIGRRLVRAIALPAVPKLGGARAIPQAIYARPQVASVGLSVDELERRHPSGRRRYTVDLTTIDRGYTDDLDHGVIVVDVERFTGAVLRAAIVGPAAAELIGLFTMAIDHSIGLRKLFGTVFPYPAYAQALMQLADDFTRATLPALPREFAAMVRGRVADRRVR